MNNLDWKKINNGQVFQRLVNDLFALEINNPAFLSSNPEIGADGGLDGRYVGNFMGIDGVWNFQAKYTGKNLKSAYNQLSGELKKELINAKKNKAEILLFVTNADLRIASGDHVGKLEDLNKGQQHVKKLFVWQKSDLESRIIQHPLLRYYYFGDNQEPMFVPPQLFATKEDSLEGALIEREAETLRFQKFVLDQKKDVLVLHAPGGFGKTSFLLEAGKSISGPLSDFEARFCRPSIGDINDGINSELNHEKNYILFLDDAERYLEEAKKLIAHTKTYFPGKLKIVLSCRTAGKEMVNSLLNSQRVDNFSVFELNPISEDGLIEILKKAAGKKSIKHPERIVKNLNGNLFLIVTTGKLIDGGDIDPQLVKSKIKSNLEHDASVALDGVLKIGAIKSLLRELSVTVPFSLQNGAVIERIATILKIDSPLLNVALKKLLDAHVLRTVGTSIRFNPDMKGDIYLAVELDQKDGEKVVNEIFETWLSVYPEKVTGNLAAAFRHSESDAASKSIKDLINTWINRVDTLSDSAKGQYLKHITPIAYLAPDETINFIYACIDTASSEDRYDLNRDIYGAIIHRILHLPGLQKRVLQLISYIDQKKIEGTYNNYEPVSLIRQAVSPLEVSFDEATESLEELLFWIDKEDCTVSTAKLVSVGVKESLMGSHEFTETYGNQMSWGRKSLEYDLHYKKAIDVYRDSGLDVLQKIIFHKNDKIKRIGVDLVDDIGRESVSDNKDFLSRILSDRKVAISWVKKLIRKDSSNELLSSIEDLMIRYWAMNEEHKDLSSKVATVLRSYPRSPEYVVFRQFVSQDIVISDFAKIEKDAPVTNRWSWLVHNFFRSHELNEDLLMESVNRLSKKYSTTKKLLSYLDNLDREIKDIRSWQYIPLMETWAKYAEAVVIKLVDNKDLLNSVPKVFRQGLYRVASDKNRKYIVAYAEDLVGNGKELDVDNVDILLDLISRHRLPISQFMPWLSKVIKASSWHVRSTILHRSYFIFQERNKDDREAVLDILELSLEGDIDDSMLDMYSFLFHHAIEWQLVGEKMDRIKSKLFEIIKNVNSIDYHVDELLNFSINGDLDKFIELIDCRLKKDKEIFDKGQTGRFDAVPYDGFNSLEKLIKDYRDFSEIMDKINTWKREDLIYSFDIDHLIKNCRKGDEESGDYIKRYIEEKVRKGSKDDVKLAISSLYGVPFGLDTANLFLDALIEANKLGIFSEARDVFSHRVVSGGYSGTVGEAPPELVAKAKALKLMIEKCPQGRIKGLLSSLLNSVEEDIRGHIERGQEFIMPKS